MPILLSSADVSREERFDWFADLVGRAIAPTEITYDRSGDFAADASVFTFGSVQLSNFSYAPLRSRRTSELIRRGDPEQYHLALVTGSPMWLNQQGKESGLVTGGMVLWDTSYPYLSGARNDGTSVRSLVLQISKRAVSHTLSNKLDHMLARTIPADCGMGAILAQYISSLAEHGSELAADEQGRLGIIATDLFNAFLAQCLGADAPLPPESREAVLREEINHFIDRNLGDPDLTPRIIASQHNISLRRLHQLFEGQSESVAAAVRHRRLSKCRADLVDPRLRHLPVYAVAARWGFASAAAFNRSFRHAYGMTPTHLRRQSGEQGCAASQEGLHGWPTFAP
ncbi:helix-turn-helix domain-containing protein [Kitasatospora sp. NBC_00240]|uniref:AraC-like ligand-binding domain-containing protein n=1 Tax=Kitasatospora sp. NBC_00240 TaxID=2903567 RepID=UPI0022509EFF|nr:helix-turn-helix domain-containing protein [Kitasatospora sp. NBC_00240]MCX5215083.1 helix-turn-helix domain-containing protein [Kitasatospora sp. NBC_00240]